jgi:hypothetical protein
MGTERGARAGGRRLLWAGVAGLGLVLGAAGLVVWLGDFGAGAPTPSVTRAVDGGGAIVARRETRPTLDPALFVGKARAAHQVAREIPGVLDRLYCYCECDKHAGHKSLLSCFTDGHAAT